MLHVTSVPLAQLPDAPLVQPETYVHPCGTQSVIVVPVVAAGNDELAVGARRACEALPNAAHREALLRARFLGVDACPTFGQKLVTEKQLHASVLTPANTGLALELLQRFWEEGRPLPLRSFTTPSPYPA